MPAPMTIELSTRALSVLTAYSGLGNLTLPMNSSGSS
jgi:hypothetical protein